MDWTVAAGTDPGWPTFLYAVPLGGGRVLLEETSLARRPGLPMAALRDRLLTRLARYGITPSPDAGGRASPLPRRHPPPPRPGRRRVRCGGAADAPGHRVQRRHGAPPGPDRRRCAHRAPARGSAGRSRGGPRGRLVTRRAGRAPAAPARPGGAAADASRGGARVLRGVLRAAGTAPLGLPHRPRRPRRDRGRHERPLRPGRLAAAPPPRRPRAAPALRENAAVPAP